MPSAAPPPIRCRPCWRPSTLAPVNFCVRQITITRRHCRLEPPNARQKANSCHRSLVKPNSLVKPKLRRPTDNINTLVFSGSPDTGQTAFTYSATSQFTISPTSTVTATGCVALKDVYFVWHRLVNKPSSAKFTAKNAAKGIDRVHQLLSPNHFKR